MVHLLVFRIGPTFTIPCMAHFARSSKPLGLAAYGVYSMLGASRVQGRGACGLDSRALRL